MASAGIPPLDGVVEICHVKPLFPRESYEVVLNNGFTFDPCLISEDYELAFQQTLHFWELKHRENGSLLEYKFFYVGVDRRKASCAIIETFHGTTVERIIRRVSQFDSVLDMHVSMCGDFERLHPGIDTWTKK